MGVFVICRKCKRKVYLNADAKTELPYSFTVRCYSCSSENSYRNYEATEERWSFTCPVCNGRFFIRNAPPRRIRCPHCSSLIYIDGTGDFAVLERGQPPVPAPGTRPIAGALGGLLLGGAVAGPIGAFLGLLAGGALGASVEYLEAREE